jgi:hypothetical protein
MSKAKIDRKGVNMQVKALLRRREPDAIRRIII